MAVLRLVSLALAVAPLAACEVTVGEGRFDGSFFDDPDLDSGVTRADGGSSARPDSGSDSGALDASDSFGDAGELRPDGGSAGETFVLNVVAGVVATAICEAREACVGAPRLADEIEGNDCVEQTRALLADGSLSSLPVSLNAGLVRYDASMLDSCAAAISATGCAWRTSRWPESCRAAFSGSVDQGDACNGDLDCEGDSYCAYGAMPTCPGSCIARGGAGAACPAGNDNACVHGFQCSETLTSGFTCLEPAGDGEPCGPELGGDLNDDPPCAAGFECFYDTDSRIALVCKPNSDVYDGLEGDQCDPFVGELCTQDLSLGIALACIRESGECEKVRLSNEACDRGKPDPCPVEQYCNETSMLCRLRERTGQPCDEDRRKVCEQGAVCLDGECTLLSRVGETCAVDPQCFSGNCNVVTAACEASVVCEAAE